MALSKYQLPYREALRRREAATTVMDRIILRRAPVAEVLPQLKKASPVYGHPVFGTGVNIRCSLYYYLQLKAPQGTYWRGRTTDKSPTLPGSHAVSAIGYGHAGSLMVNRIDIDADHGHRENEYKALHQQHFCTVFKSNSWPAQIQFLCSQMVIMPARAKWFRQI